MGAGPRTVRFGSDTPLVSIADDRVLISIEAAGVDSAISPAAGPMEAGVERLIAAWLAVMRLAVTFTDAQTTSRWCFAALDTRMPVDLVCNGSVDELARQLLKPQWLGGLVSTEHQTPYAFELAPPSIAQTSDGSLNAAAIELWCYDQIPLGLETSPLVPEAARILTDVLRFTGQVYNGGLAGFVAEAPGETIVSVYRALRTFGSNKLADQLASAIEPAMSWSPSFLRDGFTAWPEEMLAVAPCKQLGKLDGHEYPGSWYLIERELHPARNRYIRRHAAELVRSPA
jgi:hypothetical protein